MDTFAEYQRLLQWPRPRRLTRPQNQHQIKLCRDVLDIVVHYVFLSHREDLFKLCRVSKQFYLVCIPWIYREITLDFSDILSLVLLRRLSRVSSKIPAYVRIVVLVNCSSATTMEWMLLDKALSRFTRLQKLSWDNYANLPEFVLNSIHSHHPGSTVQAKVTQIYAGQATDRLVRTPTFFCSPVLEQLTSFDFSASSNEFLYDNLKRDLLELLENAPNLAVLRVYRGPVEDDGRKIFPEMLPQFRKARLPCLRALYLATRSLIFTRRELETWALRGGWSKMEHLTLSRATDLIPFIDRVPFLTYLDIIADNGEGMTELTGLLKSSKGKPLGAVKTLAYGHFIYAHDLNNVMVMHVMPWSILDKISTTLTKYISWHQPYEVFYPGFATPTTDDLCRFQGNYPGVTDLTLDIRIRHSNWPPEILAKLAAFRNVKRLSLYVHQSTPHNAQSLLRQMATYGRSKKNAFEVECKEAFRLVIDAQAKPHSEQKLQVHFKQVRNFKDMETHYAVPDYVFWINESGSISYSKRQTGQEAEPERTPRRKYAKMSSQELRSLKQHMNWKDMSPRLRGSYRTIQMADEWADMIIEITRREKNALLERLYGDESVTLYDGWISGNDL